MSIMKTGRLNLRISEKRLAKLKAYAEGREKTVTQLIEDWIDRLPSPRIDVKSPGETSPGELYDSDARGLANAPLSSAPLPNQPNG
jgi:hypothetical protein